MDTEPCKSHATEVLANCDGAYRSPRQRKDHGDATSFMVIGSLEAIVERLHDLRERFGLSYFTIYPHDIERFAPVVARLSGE